MKNIIDALNWRYATKKFDTTKKLSTEQINTLLEAIRLSPSSFGLQPWKFIVVENPEVRARLREAGYNQPQITDASHFVVFAVKKNVDESLVDKFIASVAKTQGVPIESLKGYADMINGSINSKTPEGRVEWASRQVYIALGVLVTSAAIEGIDVSPMEGFDPKKFDEILNLSAQGLESRVIAGIGFRASDDKMSQSPKVRYPKEEVFITV